jgi:hypothetical protein
MIASIPASNLRVGDYVVEIGHAYNAKVRRLEQLPDGRIEITIGTAVRTVTADTWVGVRR